MKWLTRRIVAPVCVGSIPTFRPISVLNSVVFGVLIILWENRGINMGYIMNLRKYVGHEPLIGLGATTLVFNDKKEILLNLRSDTNTWGIPGGSMELYENIRETAVRELKEECGIEAKNLELVDVLSGKEYYFEYPNGDKMCTVIVLFKVLNYVGDIKVSDNESKDLRFFPLDNLPRLESRADAIIQKILDGIIVI